jgi:hypothetical protein
MKDLYEVLDLTPERLGGEDHGTVAVSPVRVSSGQVPKCRPVGVDMYLFQTTLRVSKKKWLGISDAQIDPAKAILDGLRIRNTL